MGLLSFLGLGKAAGDAIATPVEAIGNTLDKLFTSDEERAQAEIVMERIRQKPQILQAEMNLSESQHRSVFVAGWRPFIGWVCGVALGWHYLGNPIMSWACAIWVSHITPPVINGTGDLINLLLALLGMAGFRTWEKSNKLTK
jgi:hypothetical protein